MILDVPILRVWYNGAVISSPHLPHTHTHTHTRPCVQKRVSRLRSCEGRDLTSALYVAVECRHHVAIHTHADEAAESVPAGLPRRTHVGLQLTLIHI